MRLEINLATQAYEDARRFWLRWGGTVGVAGILTIVLLYLAVTGWLTARRDRDMIRQTQAQIAARDTEKSAAEALLNRPENASTRDRSQFLNDLFQRKAFSWTQVFEDLERVMPPRLHVVSIHPEMDADNQLEIKLAVAGESRERAIELVRKMEASQHFQQTRIDEESLQISQPGGDPVKFSISAIYVPEAEIKAARGGTP
jgi:type IV pilus assembly protein PilN